jgi:alpha-1,2-glucosyltransferase
MSKPSVESPWPETLLLVLVQVWQFHNGGSRTSWGFYLLAWGLGSLWFSKVAELVPQPYLDEVFHIPQAQIYCDGRFDIWDGKITTPPGLYVLLLPYLSL